MSLFNKSTAILVLLARLLAGYVKWQCDDDGDDGQGLRSGSLLEAARVMLYVALVCCAVQYVVVSAMPACPGRCCSAAAAPRRGRFQSRAAHQPPTGGRRLSGHRTLYACSATGLR